MEESVCGPSDTYVEVSSNTKARRVIVKIENEGSVEDSVGISREKSHPSVILQII